MNIRSKILVIGNGMVGHRFLESLPSDSRFSVTVLCEEPRPAYDRVQLSAFFSGKSAEELSLVEARFFDRTGVALSVDERAVSVDRERRLVRTSNGRELEYDTLVLATGSYPFVPPIPGRDRPGCHVYRTIEDLEAIRASATGACSGVVIGGGLLGLEAAKALRDLGLETHVVEFAPRLMALQVDDGGAGMLRRRIEALGVRVHTGKNTKEIVAGGATARPGSADAQVTELPAADAAATKPLSVGSRHCVKFADGSSLETDVIVFSAGIRPRDELARAAGLIVGERGGVVIDDACRTSDPNIFAIGECALWRGKLFGLVAPGYRMAQVAAAQICGSTDTGFSGADMSTKLKLLGVDVASIGDAHAASAGARIYSFVDERRQVYKKLVVNEDGSRLLGAVLVGDTQDYGSWLQTMLNELPLPEHPEDLILPPRAGAPAPETGGAAALPATAQICSCNNVSKGAICAAVEAGCTTIGAIRKKTRAASSCGGCAPLVTQVLKAELTRKGVSVDNHLCEHFPHSRQQLFSLIRLGGLRTFEATLASHGRGSGCDICKPTVASILASCWNGFVLGGERAALQDTNDYYLANMQKDGSYSVVPRVPGGEITPDKLIVLGKVAQKFGLYTKITGGQRIDLFGARVHELPLIWADLIAAGFESGHAYGKAMRTVKSCVGSTWCRYGVQDSVALAIEIENRYRGLRALTRSSSLSPDARANAPKRRARTSASLRPRRGGICTCAATAA